MVICNFKINKKRIMKVFIAIMILLIVSIMILSVYRMIKFAQGINNNKSENSKISNPDIEITSDTYTNFLKDCHDDIDKYVGTRVSIVGYIYRMPDFTEIQFVLARTMILNSDNQAVVVGILCESNDVKNFEDNSWVSCRGTIKKGDYKGEMPVLEIEEIKQVNIPEDEFVYPPSD